MSMLSFAAMGNLLECLWNQSLTYIPLVYIILEGNKKENNALYVQYTEPALFPKCVNPTAFFIHFLQYLVQK